MKSDKIYFLRECQTVAKERGGKLISKKYILTHHKLKWQCKSGHTWHATPAAVKRGSWCPTCGVKKVSDAKKKFSIDDAHKVAKKKKGVCLSKKLNLAKDKLEWKCERGHVWKAQFTTVRDKSWCPVCGGSQRNTIDEYKEIAKSRGGKCLSRIYKNAHTKLEFKCKFGHKWSAAPTKVQQGKWCPECSSGVAESICRQFLEEVFEAPFPKSRPKWLKNSNGNQMELDGFNEKLMLGFEHHGIQHYSKVEHFQSNKEFIRRKDDDRTKERLCKKNGVTLIVIPSLYNILGVNNLHQFLHDILKKEDLLRRTKTRPLKVDINKFYHKSRSSDILHRLRLIAKENNGKLISKSCQTVRSKIKMNCFLGHAWETDAMNVLYGRWCPKCANNMKLGLEDAQELAAKRGGKCLSMKFKNVHTPLRWQCSCGNVWKANYSNVKHGNTWCPKCAIQKSGLSRRKFSIEDAHLLAKSKNGKCLSDKSDVHVLEKLKWECAEGHIWETSLRAVYSGHWCLRCFYDQQIDASFEENFKIIEHFIRTKKRKPRKAERYRGKLLYQIFLQFRRKYARNKLSKSQIKRLNFIKFPLEGPIVVS